MVSFLSETYLPGEPVNTSATWKGCDKKISVFFLHGPQLIYLRASSSIPRIAIISLNSLYFCNVDWTALATA